MGASPPSGRSTHGGAMEEEAAGGVPRAQPRGGRWAEQDGEAPQANFLLQKPLCHRRWAFSYPLVGSFFRGLGFFVFWFWFGLGFGFFE